MTCSCCNLGILPSCIINVLSKYFDSKPQIMKILVQYILLNWSIKNGKKYDTAKQIIYIRQAMHSAVTLCKKPC